jgi:hypothetical protein
MKRRDLDADIGEVDVLADCYLSQIHRGFITVLRRRIGPT